VIELLRRPDQLDRLRADPDLDANTVEEVLRYNSPVQITRRISREDVEVAEVEIPAGSVVLFAGAAANRDPRKWGDTADRFLVDRAGANEHVSFGGGPHFCLGSALARLEGQIALPRLMRRFPRLELVEETSFERRMVLRGVARLPATVCVVRRERCRVRSRRATASRASSVRLPSSTVVRGGTRTSSER
jgi:cytochrome P450